MTNTSSAIERLIDDVAKLLTSGPTPQLRAAIEQISVWITQVEVDAVGAPGRAEAKRTLNEIASAADVIAKALANANGTSPLDPQAMIGAVVAQWVAPTGAVINAQGMRALAEGARAFADKIPTGAGTRSIGSAFDRFDGRFLCAIAAVELFQAVRGHPPGRTNPHAHQLCALLWQLAGFSQTPGQQSGDTDYGSWERHLRKIVEPGVGPGPEPGGIAQGRELIRRILAQTGLISSPSPRPLGRFAG